MTLVACKHFPQWKFSLYFLATHPQGHKLPFEPESDEAFKYLNQISGTVLELTHNHGTEDDADFKYHSGNSDPRGYGHIGFIVDELEPFCDKLVAENVKFQKLPHEGRMKTIAFALDPDGYWVEILTRSKTMPPTEVVGKPSFQQTMLRIKDPKKSLQFYTEIMGMSLVNELHFEEAKFSLYFLGTFPEGTKLPDPKA
jgi:lactoylglutathione lyase